MVVNSFNITSVDIRNMNANLTGIVPDPELNAFVVAFINQNYQQLYGPIIAQTRSVWEPIVLDTANKVLRHIPFDLNQKDRK